MQRWSRSAEKNKNICSRGGSLQPTTKWWIKLLSKQIKNKPKRNLCLFISMNEFKLLLVQYKIQEQKNCGYLLELSWSQSLGPQGVCEGDKNNLSLFAIAIGFKSAQDSLLPRTYKTWTSNRQDRERWISPTSWQQMLQLIFKTWTILEVKDNIFIWRWSKLNFKH